MTMACARHPSEIHLSGHLWLALVLNKTTVFKDTGHQAMKDSHRWENKVNLTTALAYCFERKREPPPGGTNEKRTVRCHPPTQLYQ